MNKLKIIKNTIYTLALLVMLSGSILVIAGRFGIGGIRALVVQSGSMEPTIGTKSIVITVPTTQLNQGDVVTFKQSGRDTVLVTHRIVEIAESDEGKIITTKGDANEDADPEKVPQSDVVGKVIFSIPLIGSVVSFAQTTPGFIALIVVPAVLIINSEIQFLKGQLMQYIKTRNQRITVNES